MPVDVDRKVSKGNLKLMSSYTAVVKKNSEWWIGWIEEPPGVNAQGKSREELLENLRSALKEMLEINRERALEAIGDNYQEEILVL